METLPSDNQHHIIEIPFKWEPRMYQEEPWDYFENGGKRGCMCCHRRWGKDLFCINLIAKANMKRPGLYWQAFPTQAQGRKIVWDGVTKDGRPFLDHFPGYRNPGADGSLVESKREDLMQVKFKPTPDPITGIMREDGGTFQVVGLDNPDALVGPNPFGIAFSEWSLCPERAWHLFKPMLNENGGWAVFIFTMRGRNHAYKMLQRAKKNKLWLAVFHTVDDTFTLEDSGRVNGEGKKVYVPRAVITEEQIQEDRDDGVPEETIQSEYYGSADSPMPGSYYGMIINRLEKKGQICSVPHQASGLVYTAWDVGHDSTSIIFFQTVALEIHIIDFYENQGEGFAHYATILKEKSRELGYVYETFYGPHDLVQREMATGKSKIDSARKLGIKFKLVHKHAIEDGIEEVRKTLPRCWFDEKKCEHLINALRSYHKDYDEKNDVFKESPVHDWSSHPADGFRYLAMGHKNEGTFKKNRDANNNKSITSYNELTH